MPKTNAKNHYVIRRLGCLAASLVGDQVAGEGYHAQRIATSAFGGNAASLYVFDSTQSTRHLAIWRLVGVVAPEVSPQESSPEMEGEKTMHLTTRGRFAVTAMIDVALRQHRGSVTLAGISERQAISLSYLEQLFAKLRRHRLVESTRGPGGGYRLSKLPIDISIADIIFAVDDEPDGSQPAGKATGGDAHRDVTQALWFSLNQQMVEYLDSVSLASLVARQTAASRPTPTPAKAGIEAEADAAAASSGVRPVAQAASTKVPM